MQGLLRLLRDLGEHGGGPVGHPCIGIAFAGGADESGDDLIRSADQAMYRGKRRG